MGPLLIHFHFRKRFSTFLYFVPTLVGLCCDLDKLKGFGTDGEEALVYAFSHEFGFAVHLTCAIHLRCNVKQQLQVRKFPEQHRRTTPDEIFGARRGSVYLEGLINTPEKRVPFDLVATASLPDTSHLSGVKGIRSVPSQSAFYPLGEPPSFPPAVQAGLYNPQANIYNPTIHTSVYPLKYYKFSPFAFF